jgi:hypothetical protein
MTAADDDSALAAMHARLASACAEGWAIWERFDRTVRERDFHPFIAADYDVVRDALLTYRRPGLRFLEWGSASGVITILADIMGFEAYGIELDGSLVAMARDLARTLDSRATFTAGSFLPTGYRWRGRGGAHDMGNTGTGESGYLQLGRALEDFDVVFGYPWSGEAPMMLDLMHQYGRRGALLLLNDTNDGVRAYRDGRDVTSSPNHGR